MPKKLRESHQQAQQLHVEVRLGSVRHKIVDPVNKVQQSTFATFGTLLLFGALASPVQKRRPKVRNKKTTKS